MSMLTDKINSAEYIYSAQTKWGLKKYVCDVSYLTEEPLDDLFFVICSILDSNEDGHYDKRSLGVLLGFSVTNQEYEGKHDIYFDVAELRIFEDILSIVEQEHLITIKDYDICLTELGRIAIKEGKHYQFYKGTQDIYEHAMLKSETPMTMLMFPFYRDMGIWTPLCNQKQIWPDDDEVEGIIYGHMDQLKKRLELHSIQPVHIYSAELQEYFDYVVNKVPVKLYLSGKEYIPAIMNGDTLATRATELICEQLNVNRRENIVLECLFQKLWDDKSAIFNYKALEQYADLINYEELTKDSRTVWSDNDLFNLIVQRATATCWRNISRNCDIDVLRSVINEYKEKLDWPILTERIDNKFLVEQFIEYPWDLEVLSGDINRNISVIEELILIKRETEEDWNWDELENRLSSSFVLANLDVVKVNLSKYTEDTEKVHQAILNNIDKKWDWNKVETEFDLKFVYYHIASIGEHLGFIPLFNRVFTDEYWADKFALNPFFKDVVARASKENGILSSAIFNDKEYLWTENVIDLLMGEELIWWASTPYMQGFECNPNLVWSKDFFDKYSPNVSTDEGRTYISGRITEVSILLSTSSFEWNWDAISCNENLLSDKQLYTSFGANLNWCRVLENQTNVSLLESIVDINTMIGNDTDAWSAFSAIADIDYVVNKFKNFQFPWDWTVLTARMFKKFKLEKLDNKLIVEKLDWKYLSEHVKLDFLLANLDQFKNYWDWQVCLPRILTNEDRLDYRFLDNLAVILTNISGRVKCQEAWTAFTSQYSFKELKKLIKETTNKRAYWWDINYFCHHKEFYVFRDLEECRNIIDWDMLSSSMSVDNSFKYNSKLGIKERAWHDEVRKVLTDERNHWNYALLSHFESLKNERWFISQFKDQIDWVNISQESEIFCTKDKQKLNEIIDAYKKYIDFKILSERPDVDIKQVIKINPRGEYDFNKLLERCVINVTLQDVEEMLDYPWDWQIVSSSKSFIPTAKFLLDHIKCNFNWAFLSNQDNQSVWGDEQLIIYVAKNDAISEQIDWYIISSQKYFPLTKKVLEIIPLEKLNWKKLSGKKAIIQHVEDYTEHINWSVLSANKHLLTTNLDVLDKYKDHLDWSLVCSREGFVFTNEIIERFSDYIDWNLASFSLNIKFSREFVEKYKDKWNWPVLVKNKAFNNTVDIATMPYAKQLNIVAFIDQFPCRPKAYHFTHMENAVKIIRAMKLQSRNYADGKFSNSAGSNVHRTSKAHRFARFYFAPKSPTQFYNECLGKDKDDYKYYDRARNLGLPKCPLPVFFIFDIEELLSVMPDLCYYSNGNMQKDSSRCFRIVENPNRIKAREIYINSRETFDERQQEFLVDGELDFSKLKNVKICCYDSYQEEMIKHELKGTRWEDVVTTHSSLYEHTNKELYFNENSDSISINTNYNCPFEFRVSYSCTQVPTILSKGNVLRQRGNNIYLSSHVEVLKDCSFEIYFEVAEPRIGSWLVYRNRYGK